MRRVLRWLALAAVAAPGAAAAHDLDLLRLDVTADGGRVEAVLDVPVAALGLLADVDLDRDGILTEPELERRAGAVFAATFGAAPLSAGGTPCALEPAGVRPSGVRVIVGARGRCKAGDLRVVLGFLHALPAGHRVVVRARVDGTESETVGSPSAATVVLGRAERRGLGGFIALGIEHIATGYDHLLFLLGLILLGGGVRRLIGVVTSFTVAHSITLALAALGGVGLPSRLVEPAIALSIAYVAAEDYLAKEPRIRWAVAFAFGLVHGFGFAGALSELRLSGSVLVLALFGFNLGVEIGQAAGVLVGVPLLALLRRSECFRRFGVPAVALGVFGCGVYWFAERTLWP